MITKKDLDEKFIYDRLTGVFSLRSNGYVFDSFEATGYIRLSVAGRRIRAHQAAILMHYGFMPKLVDHINGDTTDNRISNLRATDDTYNARNCRSSKNNTSGVNGVSMHKASGLWHARIYNNRKCISIGYFSSIGDAAIARKIFEAILYYSPRHGER